MKRRLSAVERAPAPETKFDRYPTTEWAPVPRDRLGGTTWASAGIANVTGVSYDRVELKFLTDSIVTGRAEAEIRVAAFKHSGTSRECVSASRTMHIRGLNPSPGTGTCVVRWIHGIPHGWDYSTGEAVYTIELQHRYVVGPAETTPGGWDGRYGISGMHYCAGLPESRASATADGVFVAIHMGQLIPGSAGNVTDPFR